MKEKTHKFVLPMHKIYKITQCTFFFLVTIQCTFGCEEHNALHFRILIKKKGHMASRNLLGFGKSVCFNWMDLLDKLTVGQTN